MKPAVFLDRDGTVIEQVHYLGDPADVRVIPGAAKALRELCEAGYACVVVSNQSAVGRGVISLDDVQRVHEEFLRQLAAEGAQIDGWYFCPVAPTTSDRTEIEHPDRKPGPGMLLRAARDLELDVSRSWMVGDLLSDLHAGRNAGCRGTILVRTGYGATVDAHDSAIDYVVDDLAQAAQLIIEDAEARAQSDGQGPQRRHQTLR